MGNGLVWDRGNWPKCGKHGVAKAEIEEVLGNPSSMIVADPFEYETRFRAIGKNSSGRFVFVVFAYVGKDKRPISARYMRKKEIKRYVEDTG